MTARLAVFASGSGTNLQAMLDHFGTRDSAASVELVISDRESAAALARAERAGVRAEVIPFAKRDPEEVAGALLDVLEAERIDIIALAGFLRLIPARIIERYRGRIVNIHPALLPAFGGRGMFGERVHEAVLASGCLVTGVTVHFVTEHYDEGAAIAQWPVPVRPDDTVASLAARVLAVEHLIYPLAIERLVHSLSGDAPAARLGPPRSFAASDSAAPTSAEIARLVHAAPRTSS